MNGPKVLKRYRSAQDPPTGVFLHFVDGLTVNVMSCPLSIPRRSHWEDDGSCMCPAGTPTRKWTR